MATFYFVRHGTTDWVDKHILHGITDVPLNEDGLRQARETARAMKGSGAKNLYTSPLSRCLQTAEIISDALGLEPVQMDGLKELNFGWLEGRSFRDHSSQDFGPVIQFLDHYWHHFIRAISGEPIRKLRRRVMREWEMILEENEEGSSIIVGHSAVFNNILIHYFGKNFPDGKTYYVMRPGSINEIEITPDGRARLVRMDDVSHLSGQKVI